jgi:hypothetical protein
MSTDKALIELAGRLRNIIEDWEEVREGQQADPLALLHGAAELRNIANEVEALVVLRVNA